MEGRETEREIVMRDEREEERKRAMGRERD